MKYAILALFLACLPLADAQAVIRRNVVVQKNVVVQRNVRQRQVVVQQVVAQVYAAPVQAFVAPSYGVQAFSAGHCQQQIVAPVQAFSAGHHCQSLFK